MLISIVLPCYNDEKILPQSLKALREFFKIFEYEFELIFVNDGSVDTTLSLLEDFQDENSEMNIKVIDYDKNRGKGFAVKMGVSQADGDWFFFMDIDLATDLKEILVFIENRQTGTICVGSRVSALSHRTIYRKILGKFSLFVTKLFLGLDLDDTQCGFKFFEKNAKILFEQLSIDGFSFDLELLLLAQKNGYNIREIDVVWNEGLYSHVTLWHYFQSFLEVFRLRKKYNAYYKG